MEDKKNILLIEPNENERNSLSEFLREEMYSVEVGNGFSDAVKKISSGNYDCLIMEVDLPEIKGYEAVSIIKNLDPEIKIIMITKKNNKNLESRVREQDIFYYFLKSFGNEELILAINNALK